MDLNLKTELKQAGIELKQLAEYLDVQKSVVSNVLDINLRNRVEKGAEELLLNHLDQKIGNLTKIKSKINKR